MKKIWKRILIGLVILITLGSFFSCMYTDMKYGAQDTWFLQQYIRRR